MIRKESQVSRSIYCQLSSRKYTRTEVLLRLLNLPFVRELLLRALCPRKKVEVGNYIRKEGQQFSSILCGTQKSSQKRFSFPWIIVVSRVLEGLLLLSYSIQRLNRASSKTKTFSPSFHVEEAALGINLAIRKLRYRHGVCKKRVCIA